MKEKKKCKLDGCDNEITYQSQGVCQKHYFRFMRNGHYNLVTTRSLAGSRVRQENPKGYQMIYKPGHKLSHKSGFVYEHRFIVYGVFGDVLPGCALCGGNITWNTCHIDHIDCDVKNNDRDNLRQLCNACNTRRFYPEQHTIRDCFAITLNGTTQTPAEWSRVYGVTVCGHTIARRVRSGLTPEIAIFSPSKTYKGKTK